MANNQNKVLINILWEYNLTYDEIKYKITVNSDGEVLEIKVTNNDFYYTKSSNKIKKSEIKKSDIKEGTISL